MRRLPYAYVVVAVTFLAVFATSSVRGAPGVIIRPLELEFGWDRASISLAVAVSIFTFGLGGIFAGGAVERFGPRAVSSFGVLFVAAGLAATLTATTLWQLYLYWGVVTGIGTGAAGSVIGATIAHRWFRTHRGLVVGILGGATSMGQLILIPTMAAVTVAVGWRGALVLLIALSAAVLLPVLVFLRDRPEDVGETRFGEAAVVSAAEHAADGRSTPLRLAIRSRDFWLLAGSFFICGYTSNGLIGTHLIPHAVDHGFTEVTAAGAMALMGGMNLVGSLASGWLTDRFDPRRLLATYYGLRALSLAALPLIFDVRSLYLFAILYGLDWIATVPPTASLVSSIFGRASLGTIYGVIFFGHMLGASIAAYAGGLFHDLLGDYHLIFISATLMGVVAIGLVSRIDVRPREASGGPVAAPVYGG